MGALRQDLDIQAFPCTKAPSSLHEAPQVVTCSVNSTVTITTLPLKPSPSCLFATAPHLALVTSFSSVLKEAKVFPMHPYLRKGHTKVIS